MRTYLRFVAWMNQCRVPLFAGLLVIALALAAAASQKVRFTPKFSPGETLYYQIESRATTTGKTTTPVVNPEGGTRSSQKISLLVRLDVLDVRAPSGLAPALARLRATYEKSHAESESDAFDSEAASLDDQYRRIEGQSIEFTLDPSLQITAIKGVEDIFPDRSAAAPVLAWLNGLFETGFPAEGVAIGQKWKSERPIAAPLSGLAWITQSAYLRNEPCNSSVRAAAATNSSPGPPSMCATILTHFEISRRGSPHSDATPQDYLRNGLRTSGTWTGSGESLDSISLANGLLVSSTQSSTQEMDYQITSASTGSSIHRQGRVQSQSVITLVPVPQAAAQP
ncbi:MAG: hypothetical protein ABSE45_06760 [Candidatus Acidiferrales bacterium]|jgi:hypothetical protein